MQARETIMSALLGLVAGSSSFITASRRLRLWSEVGNGEMPAIVTHEKKDSYAGGKNYLPVVEMNVDLYVYTRPGMDSGITPISVLNPLLDAIDKAIAPNIVTRKQALGGLVSHVWIDGEVLKDPGDLDGDGVAVIPVKLLATV